MLKAIQTKYIPDLEVTDETGYFDTCDEKELMRGSLGMSARIGMMRGNPSQVKKVLDLPEDAKLTDATGEFNEKPRRKGKAGAAS